METYFALPELFLTIAAFLFVVLMVMIAMKKRNRPLNELNPRQRPYRERNPSVKFLSTIDNNEVITAVEFTKEGNEPIIQFIEDFQYEENGMEGESFILRGITPLHKEQLQQGVFLRVYRQGDRMRLFEVHTIHSLSPTA